MTDTTVRVIARRMGSGTSHYADVPPELIYANTAYSQPHNALPAPVVALCAATLHGDIVVMRGGAAMQRTRCRTVAKRGTTKESR